MYKAVILDSGETIEVRRLRIFELDQVEGIPEKFMGEYTVDIMLRGGNKTYRQLFDLSTPRTPPETHFWEVEEKSQDWYNWRSYFRYMEGFLYYAAQHEELLLYRKRIAKFIFNNCIKEEDHEKIVTPQDYVKVYLSALCPEVTMEDLRAAARDSFRATYDGRFIFDAYQRLDATAGSYRFVKVLEAKLLRELGGDFEVYSQIPIYERAILIVGPLLSDMVSALDIKDKYGEKNQQNTDQIDKNTSSGQYDDKRFSGRSESGGETYWQ